MWSRDLIEKNGENQYNRITNREILEKCNKEMYFFFIL